MCKGIIWNYDNRVRDLPGGQPVVHDGKNPATSAWIIPDFWTQTG